MVLFLSVLAWPVHAEETLIIGAVMPITGVFGFAGAETEAAGQDAVAIANAEGGVAGKKIKFVDEDGQYKQDVAMAAFQKIMSTEKPLVFLAESTAMAKALAPEFKNGYKILMGSTSFSSELADRAMNQYTFVCGPTYGDMFGILLKSLSTIS